MKFVIFSDSHGITRNLERVMASRCGGADAFIHLGDGLREFELLRSAYPDKMFVGVNGNCDGSYSADGSGPVYETLLQIENHRIFLTHGHRYGVDAGYGRLLYAAAEREADIVLFGHTHVCFEYYSDGVYLFNPGSISRPRDSSSPSWGTLEIKKSGVLFGKSKLSSLL